MPQQRTARRTSGGKGRTSGKSLKKSAAAHRKPAAKRPGDSQPAVVAGDEEVPIDRRRGMDRRAESAASDETSAAAPLKLERRKKVNRRRQIDPTTCERDYTEHEVEFMNALDDYKRKSGRMFPTCSEVLEVVRSLGYVKLSPAEIAALPAANSMVASAKPMPEDSLAQGAFADRPSERAEISLGADG